MAQNSILHSLYLLVPLVRRSIKLPAQPPVFTMPLYWNIAKWTAMNTSTLLLSVRSMQLFNNMRLINPLIHFISVHCIRSWPGQTAMSPITTTTSTTTLASSSSSSSQPPSSTLSLFLFFLVHTYSPIPFHTWVRPLNPLAVLESFPCPWSPPPPPRGPFCRTFSWL